MRVAAGHILQEIVSYRGDAPGQHVRHVIGQICIRQIRLQERVTDQHIEVKPWGHLDCGWRIQQPAEDFLQI